MIDPEVKRIDYVDELPKDDGSPFMLAMTAAIGPRGEDSSYYFQVIVCNAAWVQLCMSTDPAVWPLGHLPAMWPRGHLIVARFDIDHVREIIQELANAFRRSADWHSFGTRLNRYLLWEYEDLDDFQDEIHVPWPRTK